MFVDLDLRSEAGRYVSPVLEVYVCVTCSLWPEWHWTPPSCVASFLPSRHHHKAGRVNVSTAMVALPEEDDGHLLRWARPSFLHA